MISLLTAPDELLLEVFEHLDNIDDSLHLGRCCHRLYGLLDRNRLNIMRRIILRSEVHKYDVRLCHFSDTYDEWALKHFSDVGGEDDSIPAECHPESSAFSNCLAANTLSDRQVWDVLARWHGLALLHKLYLHPGINSAYRMSTSPHPRPWEINYPRPDDPWLEERKIDVQEEFLSNSTAEFLSSDAATLSCKLSTKQRFYLALTGFWLASEAAHFAKICRYPLRSTQVEIDHKVESLWYDDGRSLLESFDMLEVYGFVYGYLIRQTEPASFEAFLRWGENERALPNEPIESEWAYSVHVMRVLLRPADIIELLILTPLWRKAAEEHPKWSWRKVTSYLRVRSFSRGAFPGQVAVDDVDSADDEIWYSFEDMERAVEQKLPQFITRYQRRAAQRVWRHYREDKWETDARGTALFWATSGAVIVDRLIKVSG